MKTRTAGKETRPHGLSRSHILFPRDPDDPGVVAEMTKLGFTFYPSLGVWVALDKDDNLEDLIDYINQVGYPAPAPE